MEKQHTLENQISFSGIALHTGARAGIKFLPAPTGHGVTFHRADLPGKPFVKATATNVVDVRRGTTIAANGAQVHTVEHVLAALYGTGIDNAIIEMDGPEPPVGDGSSLPFLEMINRAGRREQEGPVSNFTPSAPIIIEKDETKLILTPAENLQITCLVSYGATPLDVQYFSGHIATETFGAEIAGARTFCLYRELEQLIAMGLVKGGSLDNAVILHNGAIISKEGLRYPNELVRHKVLDIIGDLYLTGFRLKAHLIAVKPGHPTNVRLAKEILKQAINAN